MWINLSDQTLFSLTDEEIPANCLVFFLGMKELLCVLPVLLSYIQINQIAKDSEITVPRFLSEEQRSAIEVGRCTHVIVCYLFFIHYFIYMAYSVFF
jgi:hypothetical protein